MLVYPLRRQPPGLVRVRGSHGAGRGGGRRVDGAARRLAALAASVPLRARRMGVAVAHLWRAPDASPSAGIRSPAAPDGCVLRSPRLRLVRSRPRAAPRLRRGPPTSGCRPGARSRALAPRSRSRPSSLRARGWRRSRASISPRHEVAGRRPRRKGNLGRPGHRRAGRGHDDVDALENLRRTVPESGDGFDHFQQVGRVVVRLGPFDVLVRRQIPHSRLARKQACETDLPDRGPAPVRVAHNENKATGPKEQQSSQLTQDTAIVYGTQRGMTLGERHSLIRRTGRTPIQ